MKITHLSASFMFGGPERQMLGLAEQSRSLSTHSFLSFNERGNASAFVREARKRDFSARILANDTPRLLAARLDAIRELRRLGTHLLLCHGYKSNLVGRWAARQIGIPAVAVCRGWTGESMRIRLYEAFDRSQLRRMDAVVAVSTALARQINRYGVPKSRLHAIPNAVRPELFNSDRDASRERLLRIFRAIPADSFIIGAAGRLSPEKGFDLLVEAAEQVLRRHPQARFILFGDGREREALFRSIAVRNLSNYVFLAGFTDKLDMLLPGCDAFVSSSHTEGMPNVLLEATAMGLPIVATAVGGVPEIVQDRVTGLLVPPQNADLLAEGIASIASDVGYGRQLGLRAKAHVAEHFSFEAQATSYAALARRLTGGKSPFRKAA